MRSRLAAIVESSDDAIVSQTPEGIITSWNPAAERIFGYSAAETIGRSMRMLFPADRLDEESKILTRLKRGERTDHFETVRIRKDGRRIDMSITLSPICDGGGKVIGASKVARDITERKRTEAAAAHLAAIVHSTDDAIIGKDLNNLITSWNLGAERLFGYPAGEMLGTSIMLLIPPEQQPQENDIQERVKHGLSMEKFETVRQTRDGRLIAVSITASPIRDAGGKVVGVSKVARNITERKQAETAVRESEAKLTMAFASMSEAIFIADASGRLTDFNDEFVRYHRFKNRDECSLTIADCPNYLEAHFADGTPAPPEQWAMARALRGETASNVEFRLCRKETGETWWGSYSFSPIRDKGGALIGAVVSAREITVLKQAEVAVRESEARFRTMANSMAQLAWIARPDGFLYWYNQRWYDYTGTTPDQMEGWGWQSVHDPAMLPKVMKNWAEAIAVGQPFEMEFPLRGANGQFRTFLTRGQPLKDAAGQVMQWFGTNTDITVHKEAERKLQEQLARLALFDQITRAISERLDFQSILQAVTDNLEDNLPADFCCVGLFDEQSQTFKVAQVGTKSTPLAIELAMSEHAVISMDCDGLSQSALGQLFYQPDSCESKFPFPRCLAKGGLRSLVIAPLPVEGKVIGFLIVARHEPHSFVEGECEFLKQLSEHLALASHQAKLHGALQTAYDELHRTQQVAMQQARLSAFGQMASGIAHDINNAISPMMLYTESLLENEPNLTARARDYLQIIHRSVRDVAETIGRMREFYRQREPQLILTPIQLNALAQQVLDLTRVHWRDDPQKRGVVIETEVLLAEDLPEIMGVESEIRDALVNLIFNGLDAMPEGGTLRLRTVTELIAPDTGGAPGAPGAPWVRLELTDTGKGMDEDTRCRCLEPFFTTKGERGMGLGLAMVYGMIKRHSAGIEIKSAPLQGTTVTLLFPVSVVVSNGVDPPSKTKSVSTGQRILFIDDDPRLVKSMRDILETEGHAVVTANGGQEGIHAFIHGQERNEPFTLVITDLGMPQVDGRKVAQAVKAASPTTPVVLLTGWAQRMEAECDIPPDVDQMLSKPPKLHELREVLATCCLRGHSQPMKGE